MTTSGVGSVNDVADEGQSTLADLILVVGAVIVTGI